ncbi:MAG: pilus assembly protein PilM [Eubacteriales bacterium]|nr:pilus assembly protein PilM [Eubacteriales bacterium]MDD4583293.1 pilus assembly protein PilM [Eubacteriales bacterium]
MNLLTIQIEKNIIQLANISKRGESIYINKMRRLFLPDNLKNGEFTSDTAAFSDFIDMVITKGKLSKGKAILLLGADCVIHREYTHEELKKSQLVSLAILEANAILPEDEGTFIVENQWYGSRHNKEGLQTSAIFAVNQEFITSLTNELKAKGIKLSGIFPTMVAHTDLIRKLLNYKISGLEFSDKTVAAIHLSPQETQVSLFHNRQLIHQRTDSLAVSEFYQAVATTFQLSADETESYINNNPESLKQVEEAASLMITTLIRSINIVSSVEGLRIDNILISGGTASIPGMAEFFTEVTEIPCSNIEQYKEALSKIVTLQGELKEHQEFYQRLVLLRGLDYKKRKELNFLTRGIQSRRRNRRTLTVCITVFILMVLVMAILPINYYIINKDIKRNKAIIASPEYVEIKNLLEEQRQMRAQVTAIDEEKASLPFGDSLVAHYLKILNTDLFNGATLNSITYKEDTGTFNVIVTGKDLDYFIMAKNKIDQEENLMVSLPLTFRKEEGLLRCEMTITVLPEKGEGE